MFSRELLISDILDVRNAESYDFDGLYALFKMRGRASLSSIVYYCAYFQENLQNLMDLFYNVCVIQIFI